MAFFLLRILTKSRSNQIKLFMKRTLCLWALCFAAGLSATPEPAQARFVTVYEISQLYEDARKDVALYWYLSL